MIRKDTSEVSYSCINKTKDCCKTNEQLEAENAELRQRLAEVENPWIKLTNKPEKDGWYGVCYTGNKSFAMYFRTKKRHYSDSQWFVDDNTGHSWQGKLPDYYCHLPSTKQITGDL